MMTLSLIVTLCMTAPAPTADAVEPAVSEAERAALEAALGADTATTEASAPVTPSGSVGALLQSLNPDISLILGTALAWFSGEPGVVGAHDPSETGFNLQQLELSLSASVDHAFRLDATIVFGLFGVEVEEAYATTLGLPGGLKVRAGQFLTRIGRQNPAHPHSWTFLTQHLVNGKFLGPEGSRGLGVELSWLTPLPWYVEVIGATTLAGGARSFYDADAPDVDGLEDLLYTVTVSQFFPLSDDWSLSWGLSAQLGPNATGPSNRSAIYASDLFLRWRPLEHAGRTSVDLTVEGFVRAREVPRDQLTDWGTVSHLVWQLDPTWELGVRHDFVHALPGDPLDPLEVGDRHRLTLHGGLRPSHFSRLRLEAGWDKAAWRDDATWSLALGLEVQIGAHGAHTY